VQTLFIGHLLALAVDITVFVYFWISDEVIII